jgi:hypothetical protein
MPQLDLMHFFSQFFWFSIGFFVLYAFVLHNIIPAIAMNLKFRQKKIYVLATNINENKYGSLHLFKTYDSFIIRLFRFMKIFSLQIVFIGFDWLSIYTKIINNHAFFYINKLLILIVATYSEEKLI